MYILFCLKDDKAAVDWTSSTMRSDVVIISMIPRSSSLTMIAIMIKSFRQMSGFALGSRSSSMTEQDSRLPPYSENHRESKSGSLRLSTISNDSAFQSVRSAS